MLKVAATLISYVSGIPGGIMAPTLSAGAGLGYNIAHIFSSVPMGAAIILGMVSYFQHKYPCKGAAILLVRVPATIIKSA